MSGANGACNNYVWSPADAGTKLWQNVSPRVATTGVGFSIRPDPQNPHVAYRNCDNCHKHFNYHPQTPQASINGGWTNKWW